MTPALVTHPIPPVWSPESSVLLLGTMPSPASRRLGFYYMHPQNRFWRVLPLVFGEPPLLPNDAADRRAAISERRDFLARHGIALWDVLSSCEICGAADSSIRREVPNDFSEILAGSRIRRVFFTGKAAEAMWKRRCASLYEGRFRLETRCLPSTSPANARFSLGMLAEAYGEIRSALLP